RRRSKPLLSRADRSFRIVTSEVSKREANASTLTSPSVLSSSTMARRRCWVLRLVISVAGPRPYVSKRKVFYAFETFMQDTDNYPMEKGKSAYAALSRPTEEGRTG